MELHLTPSDIKLLRDAHIADAGPDERALRALRAENWALTNNLADVENEAERLYRQRSLLAACIVGLLVACGWLGWLAGQVAR